MSDVRQRRGLAEQQLGALLDVVDWGEFERGVVVAGGGQVGVHGLGLAGGLGESGARPGFEAAGVLAELARAESSALVVVVCQEFGLVVALAG